MDSRKRRRRRGIQTAIIQRIYVLGLAEEVALRVKVGVQAPQFFTEHPPNMSVDKAFREMIRNEITQQLKPLQDIVARLQSNAADLDSMREMTASLAPLAQMVAPLFNAAQAKRGPGRPRKNALVIAPAASVKRAASATDACAVIGCKHSSRTKGYCSAHYQKLRLLIKTGRRPTTWVDHAGPQSVENIKLPRGRAAAKAKTKQAR